ncbi:MAG: ParB/RepB/Spo0J family partition protein [Chloroflexota bacterium]|nr:ParB/RepB/Spo0J family partition protein [Chloroflexota bacterium]
MPSAKKSIAELLDNRRPVVTERANIASPQGERFNADAKYVDLSRIKPNPNQPRRHFDTEAMDELAASIRQDGVLQPIVVRPVHDGYQIIMGERRYRASLLAGMAEVPVIVRGMDDEEAFLAALVENLQRANLDPADEADAYQGLLARGYSARGIAERLAVSHSRISKTIRVYEDPLLSQAVGDGQITKSEAQELLVIGQEERPRLVQFIAGRRKDRQPLKMSEIRQEVKHSRLDPSGESSRQNMKESGSNRTTPEDDAMILREAYALIWSVVESRPVVMWDPEVSVARRVIEDTALKVSGRPWTEGSVTRELALESAEGFERAIDGWVRWLGDLAYDPEVSSAIARIRDRLPT